MKTRMISRIQKSVIAILVAVVFLSAFIFLISAGLGPSGSDLLHNEIKTQRSMIKEVERLLSESVDSWTWQGSEYYRDDVEQQVRDMKRTVNQYVLLVQVLPVVVTVGSVYLIFLISTWSYRCRECKKLNAMKKTKTRLISSGDIHVKMELKNRSAYDGRVLSTSEQYVPGKRTNYETVYTCKYCGAEKSIYRTSEHANL